MVVGIILLAICGGLFILGLIIWILVIRFKEDEDKKEFNIVVKSNYSTNAMGFVELINKYMIEDEKLINAIFKKFKVDLKVRRRLKVYSDIKQKWSVGIIEENY